MPLHKVDLWRLFHPGYERASSFRPDIGIHLFRVLHTVLTERSVSKVAIRLGLHRPALRMIEPAAPQAGAKGAFDDHLGSLGLQRAITTRCPGFSLIQPMVASTLLVLTTGRQFCERFC